MARVRGDSTTLELLAWQPAPVAVTYDEPEIRAASIAARYCRAMKLALDRCGRSRADIAAAMSEYLGEAVTENMLNRYLSEAAEDHTINVIRFEALIHATEQWELLAVQPERFGFAVIPAKYLHLIEAIQLEEKAAEMARRAELAKRKFQAGTRS
ncbi:MAG: DNA transposition protein [Ferrovibrionaceae bacterium]